MRTGSVEYSGTSLCKNLTVAGRWHVENVDKYRVWGCKELGMWASLIKISLEFFEMRQFSLISPKFVEFLLTWIFASLSSLADLPIRTSCSCTDWVQTSPHKKKVVPYKT